jgi:hypothetical protein
MPRQCIFCENKADSLEHLWPRWILNLVPKPDAIRIKIGNSPAKIVKKTDHEIKAVCYRCNEGWMSDLENDLKPTLGQMIQDSPIVLNPKDQTDIAVWAVKVAMVLEASTSTIRGLFYTERERQQLRLARTLPPRTTVLLGRFVLSSLLAEGTTLRANQDGMDVVAHNNVTAIVVGHAAIQVFTIHPIPEYEDRLLSFTPMQGPWNRLVVPIWPATSVTRWPLRHAFTNDKGMLSIGWLQGRWGIGQKVPVSRLH